jgi:CBS domain-containing protein
VALTEGLKGVQVRDIMTGDCVTLDGNMNVEQFVDNYLLRSGRRCFVVQQNGEISGLVTPHEIKELERPRWPYMTLADVMRPLDQIHTVTPATPVMEALETMGRDDVNQLPVLSGGHLDGIITRANVVQFLQTRAELRH